MEEFPTTLLQEVLHANIDHMYCYRKLQKDLLLMPSPIFVFIQLQNSLLELYYLSATKQCMLVKSKEMCAFQFFVLFDFSLMGQLLCRTTFYCNYSCKSFRDQTREKKD